MAPGHKQSGIGSFGLERVMGGLLSCGFAGLVSVAIDWA
jgi:hypothetical protein